MAINLPQPPDLVPVWKENKKIVNVIVETPRNSRNKYKFDSELGIFKLGGVLALGHSFPFDFGYIPQTNGGDGDPLDVLVLMDEPAFPGCLVECRLIGGLKAFQTEKDGPRERNDRLMAVHTKSIEYSGLVELDQLSSILLDQIEHFFVSYNEAKGKKFKVTRRFGPRDAVEIVSKAVNEH